MTARLMISKTAIQYSKLFNAFLIYDIQSERSTSESNNTVRLDDEGGEGSHTLLPLQHTQLQQTL